MVMNFKSFLIAKDFMYKETTDDSETLFVRESLKQTFWNMATKHKLK